MSGYSFKDRNVAMTLRRMAERQMYLASTGSPEIPDVEFVSNMYLCVPREKITAASYVTVSSVKKLKLGTGRCYIHRRDTDPTAKTFYENNQNNPSYLNITSILNPITSALEEIRIYNWNFFEIPAGPNGGSQIDVNDPILMVQQDAFGDYHLTGEIDAAPLPAQITSTLPAQGSAPAFLLNKNNSGPGMSASTRNIMVYDWMMNIGDSIAAQTRMWVQRKWGYFYTLVPNCSPSTVTSSIGTMSEGSYDARSDGELARRTPWATLQDTAIQNVSQALTNSFTQSSDEIGFP